MISIKLFLLFAMIFCHIVDDYYLQGWLANAKQKSWWESNYPNQLYKHDYIMALFMHSFSWAFMIMLPYHLYVFLVGGKFFPFLIITNLIIHMYIDHMKANLHRINLITDQCMHIWQIFVTWLCLIKLNIW